jgi:hypothetical protein
MGFAGQMMTEFVKNVDKLDWTELGIEMVDDKPVDPPQYNDQYFAEIKDYVTINGLYQFLIFLRLKPKLEDDAMLVQLQSLYDSHKMEWHHKVVFGNMIAGLQNNIRLKKANFD